MEIKEHHAQPSQVCLKMFFLPTVKLLAEQVSGKESDSNTENQCCAIVYFYMQAAVKFEQALLHRI
jgi:hypothetical protein